MFSISLIFHNKPFFHLFTEHQYRFWKLCETNRESFVCSQQYQVVLTLVLSWNILCNINATSLQQFRLSQHILLVLQYYSQVTGYRLQQPNSFFFLTFQFAKQAMHGLAPFTSGAELIRLTWQINFYLLIFVSNEVQRCAVFHIDMIDSVRCEPLNNYWNFCHL